ncbi:ATP-binding protein [Burkholderia sp. Z1]|uniref:ATP-binding protein n=1 Tax=Burkholderia sp. Z1 TaxID=2759039 RepID=UPI00186895BB|nr:transporter substrate-binding domain-containing protein [Burkholderia sp. Z1]
MRVLRTGWPRLLTCVASFVCAVGIASAQTELKLVAHDTTAHASMPLSTTARAWLTDHHDAIRVGTVPGALGPLDLVDANGGYVGISAEYLGALADSLPARVSVIAFPDRASLDAALTAGQVDLATTARRNPADRTRMTSAPYFANKLVLATRIDHPAFAIREHAGPAAIAYVPGDGDPDELRRAYPSMTPRAYPTLERALAAVAFGEADACIGNATALNYLIERQQLQNVAITRDALLDGDDFRFAALPRNAPLVQMIDAALATISATDRAAIRTRWEGLGTHYALGTRFAPSQRERDWIAAHRDVRFAAPADVPPFAVATGSDTVTGFAADLLDLIGARAGFDPVRVPIAPGADVPTDIPAMMVDEAGHAPAGWTTTTPYASTPAVIVARAGQTFGDLASLHGRRIVVAPGSGGRFDALSADGVNVERADDAWAAAERVERGKADAFVTNIVTASYVIDQRFRTRLAIVGRAGDAPVQLAFAVRAQDAPLATLLDRGLASIPAPRMDALREQWRADVRIPSRWDQRRPEVLAFVAGIAVLAVLFLVWNHRLRRQIARRKRAEAQLETAKLAAEDANRAKSTFLATMSHEIRTPMNAVLGVLELLGETDEPAERRQVSLDAAQEAARSLLALIDDILDLSRIESGKLELHAEPTDCAALIRGVAAIFAGVARQRQVGFRVDIDGGDAGGVLIDPVRFRQILSNLLSNAVKFTQEGEVALSARLSRDGDTVSIDVDVTDTGIGIALDQQARLFEPFSQAAADIGPRYGGSGLGLSICRRLADLMGGELSLTSTPGVGTAVRFRLRAYATAIPASTRLPRASSDALRQRFAGRTALIVDDHPANRFILERQLTHLGFRVACAGDGPSALSQWKKDRPDVVVTDCYMPGMTGYTLARAIRDKEAHGHGTPVAIIGCTADIQPGLVDRARAAGMDDCVRKPLGLRDLAEHLERLLGVTGAAPIEAADIPVRDATAETLLDAAAIERITAGDIDAERQLLTKIAESNRDDGLRLSAAAASNDRSSFRAILHRLCGPLTLIGAHSAEHTCRLAEQRALDEGTPLSELEPAVQAALAQLGDAIDARIVQHARPQADSDA